MIDICRDRAVISAFIFSHVSQKDCRTENDKVDADAGLVAQASFRWWEKNGHKQLTVWKRDAVRIRKEHITHAARIRMSNKLGPMPSKTCR